MTCRACGMDKPEQDMRLRLGKRASICKRCDAARASAYYAANRDERTTYNRSYRLRPEALSVEKERGKRRQADLAYRARQAERHRERRKCDDFREYNRAYWHRYDAAKKKAHAAVKYALKTGRLAKPAVCEGCATATRLHGHHEDYSQPLIVRWLCPRCHKAAHAAKETAVA